MAIDILKGLKRLRALAFRWGVAQGGTQQSVNVEALETEGRLEVNECGYVKKCRSSLSVTTMWNLWSLAADGLPNPLTRLMLASEYPKIVRLCSGDQGKLIRGAQERSQTSVCKHPAGVTRGEVGAQLKRSDEEQRRSTKAVSQLRRNESWTPSGIDNQALPGKVSHRTLPPCERGSA